jgi:hypothetical protein
MWGRILPCGRFAIGLPEFWFIGPCSLSAREVKKADCKSAAAFKS